jgi:hypothetical protein
MKNESASSTIDTIVIKTSMNCSGVESPEKTALKETFNFSMINLGVRSFIAYLYAGRFIKVLLHGEK